MKPDGYSSWRLGWHMPELARPSEEYIGQVANKTSQEIDRQLYGAFTGFDATTEAADAYEPDPFIAARDVFAALGNRPIVPDVYINEWMPEKDEKGEILIIGMDTMPTKWPYSQRQKGIVMHPAVYLKVERLLPVGITVYGYEAVRRYLDKKKRALYLATLPTIPVHIPIVVLMMVMIIIMILAGR